MTRWIAVSLLCTVTALASPAFAQSLDTQDATARETMRTVSVTGVAEVAAVPDLAQVTIGVVTEAVSASAAMEANTSDMNRLLTALDEAGVESRDRQTFQLQITPNYRFDEADRSQTLVGYTARNTLSVRIRDIAATGDVLDALIQAGANQLEGISFDVSDKEQRLDEARREAVADARRKAVLLAESAGLTLGGAVSLSDMQTPSFPQPMMRRGDMMMAAEAVPIEAGEQMLEARVSTVWELLDAPE